MQTTQIPLNKAIAFIQQKPQAEGVPNDIVSALNKFLDVLKYRVNHVELNLLAQDLLADLFYFRILAISWLAKNPNFLLELNQMPVDEIIKAEQRINYLPLNKTLSDCLAVYYQITAAKFNQINTESNNFEPLPLHLTYEGFQAGIMATHPQPELFLSWLESSLVMEMGFILIDLVNDGKIQPNKYLVKDLQSLVKNSTEKFGAYAILMNQWQPSKGLSDNNQLIRNIEILSRALRFDYQKPTQITGFQDLETLLLN